MGLGISNSELELWRVQQQNKLQGTDSTKSAEETTEQTINFSSGTTTTSDIADIEADYLEAEEAVKAGKSDETSETKAASETEQTPSTGDTGAVSGTQGIQGSTATSGASSDEIKEEIEKLEEEKEENMDKMDKIEAKIEDLAKSAEENIMKAAAAQEDAVKEHEEETQKALDENIQAYIEANKEGGEGMTRDELQENIKNALPNTPEIGEAVAALTAASEEVNEIDSNLAELNKLISDTQLIEDEIEAKQGEYEAAVEAEEQAKCCDPIGFTTTDENGNEVQYDFIKDDGSFDSTDDFLGSEGQWSEMAALDTDGDNIVSAEELQAGNIKAVKTNADGSQEIVDLAEEFGDDFSIDLSSYQEGGSHSSIDTTADDDGDGTANQQLLGTFNVNINGETANGYNTLDDTDWLSENYGVSSAETEDMQYSQDLQPHVNFFNEYTAKSEELKSQISQGFEDLGVSKEQMDSLNETTKKEADENAKNFFASLGLNEDDMTTEKETETTESATSEDQEKDKEREKELLLAA